MDSTADPTAGLDVKTAVATLDRALAYSGPLQRRTEGITWILFGLTTALFGVYYTWLSETGRDPSLRWLAPSFIGYASLCLGLPLLSWRVAGAVISDYVVDAKRVFAGIMVLAVVLIASNFVVWSLLNEYPRFSIAFNGALAEGSAWAILGLAQWSRMSASGRRDTLVLGAAMVVVGFVLLYVFGTEVGTLGANTLVGVIAFCALPMAAGVWRLVRR